MNLHRGLIRLWIVVSVAWVLGSGIIWYQDFEAEGAQIAALDECGKIFHPLPDGFVLDAPIPPWGVWEDDQAKLHPQCAPNVASTALSVFIGMHASEREALRQRSEDAIRASTITAVTDGIVVPAGLLVIGLVLGWVTRGFRTS